MELDLSTLTLTQQRDLYARLGYNLREKKAREFSQLEANLFGFLKENVAAAKRMTLEMVAKDYGVIKFAEKAHDLDEFLAVAIPGIVRRNVRGVLVGAVGRCLCDYLEANGQPITTKTLLNNFDKLKFCVDRQYPGYIDAGLLPRLAPIFVPE